jgi:hypothetical protein
MLFNQHILFYEFTGGDIVNNRHYLAKILQSEAQKKGLTLIIHPEHGTIQALEKVSAGQLDLAA